MTGKAKTLTLKQKKFCLAYMETGNASEAYRRAYNTGNMKPETIKKRASELRAVGDITGTLKALQSVAQERTLVTVESLTAEGEEARKLAMKLDQPSAAVAAIMAKGKLNGLLVDKHEHESPNGTMTPKGLGDFYASTQVEGK